jgi:flagellar biosynthesis/type III secretory pathway chaperone
MMSIQALVETMESLIEVHASLLDLAKDKTPVLVENQVDKLNQIVNHESKLVKRVVELDQQRIQITGEYLLARGYRPDSRVTISDFIKMIFKAEEKKTVQDVHLKLSLILIELKDINSLNQKLIDQSLAFIEYSLDIISGPFEDDTVYHHPAQQVGVYKKSSYFDTRA